MKNGKWQMANGKSSLSGRPKKRDKILVLPHFEKIDPHQFPIAVAARKNVERGTGLLFAQLLSLKTYVGGEQIRIPLFGAQNP
jgi:hypothetical protein